MPCDSNASRYWRKFEAGITLWRFSRTFLIVIGSMSEAESSESSSDGWNLFCLEWVDDLRYSVFGEELPFGVDFRVLESRWIWMAGEVGDSLLREDLSERILALLANSSSFRMFGGVTQSSSACPSCFYYGYLAKAKGAIMQKITLTIFRAQRPISSNPRATCSPSWPWSCLT